MMITSRQCALVCTILFLSAGTVHATDARKPEPQVVPVAVQNTPNVVVTGSVGATIKNGPSDPVPVRSVEPATEPFQTSLSLLDLTGQGSTAQFSVPPGKRMVIEQISMSGEARPGTQLSLFQIATAVASSPYGGSLPHYLRLPALTPVLGHPELSEFFSADYLTKIYADPGTVVSIKMAVTASPFPHVGIGSATVTISGYLVPIQ